MANFYDELLFTEIVHFPNYFIDDFGNVFSKYSNKFLSQSICPNCYLKVNIGGKTRRVHILVATTLIPNPDNKPQVNHKDGNKLNPHKDNLEWSTASENVKHSFDFLNRAKPYTKSNKAHHSKGKSGFLSTSGKPIKAILPTGEEKLFGSSNSAGIELFNSKFTGKSIRQAIIRNKNGAYRGIKFSEH